MSVEEREEQSRTEGPRHRFRAWGNRHTLADREIGVPGESQEHCRE